MKLELIKNAVTSTTARQFLKVQKHSPVILFGTGVVGVISTAVLASRATLKMDSVLEAHEKKMFDIQQAVDMNVPDYTEMDAKRDSVIVHVQTIGQIARLYGPAFACAVITIASLTGSHYILTKRNMALTAAYAALEKGFAEYRQRVIADVGVEKDRDYRYGKEVEVITELPDGDYNVKTVRSGDPSIYARFFDEYSQSWKPNPDYNRAFLASQQAYWNNMLQMRGHVFLNEVYDALGLERSKAGAVVGWVMTKDRQGDNFVDFGIFRGDERSRSFINGLEGSIFLDFNVDGVIYDKI